MNDKKTISGFSSMRKRDKIKWMAKTFFTDPEAVIHELSSYWHSSDEQQKILDGFSENTISNFPMPFGVAPNFLIDDKTYCVPMVIEESSVVAAASAAAKFWMSRGGIHTEVIGTKKLGQVHFLWYKDPEILKSTFAKAKEKMLKESASIEANMKQRGGGILDIELIDLTKSKENYYQLKASFETCDSMGANFINTCLEQFAQSLKNFYAAHFGDNSGIEIIMSILSNYTPECLVKAWVECPIEDLGEFKGGLNAAAFAKRFKDAIDIAEIDPYRAATHNKGIYNGIDAVVLATGNDFRAIEACGHAYAAENGYSSLSHCELKDGNFYFYLEVPLAIGTVGGLTSLHPIAKRSLELLEKPSAKKLMRIIAATGLAQNFAAVRSLVTTGIQEGHMKMHLQNILVQLKATDEEFEKAISHFQDRMVSFAAVREFLSKNRKLISPN